ncbi:MAG: sensor histidine kinase [Deltaproteobacteria bacterium]|nr:sensor histidine kinase [Deltaproteobacteria bacterium]
MDLLNHGELLVVIRACPGTALESAVLARIRSGALPLPLEFVRQVVAHASAAPLDWKERLEHVDRTVRPLPRPFIDVAPLLKDGAPDWRSRVPAKLPELAPWEQRRFNIRAAEPEVARLLIASWVDEAATGPTTDLEYGVLAAVLRRAHIAEFLADDEKALSVIAECARRILLARAGNERRFVRSGEVAASALLALLAQCVLLRSLGGEMAPVFSALLAGVQHPVDQNWWPRVRLAAEAAEVDVSSWGPGSPDGVRQLREQLWHLASCQIGQQQSAALEILRCRHHDRGLLIDKLADAFSHWVKNIPGGDTAVPRLARALLAFDACPQSAGDELDEIVPEAERLARITCPARVARITFEGQDDDSGSAMRIPRLPLVLVMAEFIANALEHGSGAEVRVKSPGQHCWIEVECEAEDSLRAASIMNQRPGLGLQLCLALCRHFGYEFAAISDRGVVRMEIKKSETRRRPR